MAYTKIWPVKGSTGKSSFVVAKIIKYDKNEAKTVSKTFNGSEIANIIRYTSDSDKTAEHKYITAINCTEEFCIDEMICTKQRFGERGNRVMYHGVQSFKPGEIDRNDPGLAHQLGVKLARTLWGDRFQVIVTTHLDREHIHNHFAVNSVSYVDGKKFDWNREYVRMRDMSDKLCTEHMLSVIEGSEDSRNYHRGELRADSEGRYTIERIVKEDIDACIYAANNLNEWFDLMKGKGYRIDNSGKYLRVYPYGHKRCIRVDRRFLAKYGQDYSLRGISEMIAFKDHQPETSEDKDIAYMIEKLKYIPDSYDGKIFKEYGFKLPKRPKGIQKVYNRYLYILGVHPACTPARIARTHYILREDLLKLDRYIAENNILISRDITDMDSLKSVVKNEVKKLSDMDSARNKIRNRIRRSKEDERQKLYDELAEINREIKLQRKNVYYMKDIEKSITEINAKLTRAEHLGGEKKKTRGSYISERGR